MDTSAALVSMAQPESAVGTGIGSEVHVVSLHKVLLKELLPEYLLSSVLL